MSKKSQQNIYAINVDPEELDKMIDQELVNTSKPKPKTRKDKTKWINFDNHEKKTSKSEIQQKEVQNLLAAHEYQYKEVLEHSKLTDQQIRIEKEWEEDRRFEAAIRMSKEAEERRIKALKEEEEMKKTELRRIRKLEKDRLKERLIDIFKFDCLIEMDFDKMALYLNEYETNTDTFLNDFSIERSSRSMNGKSALIIDVIKVLRSTHEFNVKKILKTFSKYLEDILEVCRHKKDVLFAYNPEIHELDKTSEFSHKSLNDKLKVIDIRGDGNCVWNSISTALFGDYSMMESLRVLTAYILLENETEFIDYFNKQESKYGYKPELSFDDLVNASTELQVWGDENHILALSLALNRPIYSYGSLANMNDRYFESYDDFKKYYESDSLPNHFKYIADDLYDTQKPILLYYNGENHYNVILPTSDSLVAPVPKSQLLDPIIEYKTKVKESEQSTSQAETIGKNQAQSCNKKEFESLKTTELMEKFIETPNNFKDYEVINECKTEVCKMTLLETNELQELKQKLQNTKSYLNKVIKERDDLRNINNSLENQMKELKKRNDMIVRYLIRDNTKESTEKLNNGSNESETLNRHQFTATNGGHQLNHDNSQSTNDRCSSLSQSSLPNYSSTVNIPVQTQSRTQSKDSEDYEDQDSSEMDVDETDL